MKRFIEGEHRSQSTLFPEHLDDYIAEDNPVRVIDVFVDEMDLMALGFEGMQPEVTGRPGYHPASLLKIYIYGYLNRIQSSRRIERETQRNVELIWLTGRLMPDFKTIRRLSQGQWQGDPQRVSRVHRSMPGSEAVFRGDRGHRRQQVQSGQQSRQELHSPRK
jgi:transposase